MSVGVLGIPERVSDLPELQLSSCFESPDVVSRSQAQTTAGTASVSNCRATSSVHLNETVW